MVVSVATVDGEDIKSCSHMAVTGVGRVCLVDGFVRLELFSACITVILREYFQSDIVARPGVLVSTVP